MENSSRGLNRSFEGNSHGQSAVGLQRASCGNRCKWWGSVGGIGESLKGMFKGENKGKLKGKP
jgi:hypothetical protein